MMQRLCFNLRQRIVESFDKLFFTPVIHVLNLAVLQSAPGCSLIPLLLTYMSDMAVITPLADDALCLSSLHGTDLNENLI